MKWLTDTDRVKVQWRIVALNLMASAVNLGIFTWNIANLRWIALANIAAGLFSAWVAWTMYKKIPAIKREQEQRIVDILSGKIQPNYID